MTSVSTNVTSIVASFKRSCETKELSLEGGSGVEVEQNITEWNGGERGLGTRTQGLKDTRTGSRIRTGAWAGTKTETGTQGP